MTLAYFVWLIFFEREDSPRHVGRHAGTHMRTDCYRSMLTHGRMRCTCP